MFGGKRCPNQTVKLQNEIQSTNFEKWGFLTAQTNDTIRSRGG
jgi:hypothetical protein